MYKLGNKKLVIVMNRKEFLKWVSNKKCYLFVYSGYDDLFMYVKTSRKEMLEKQPWFFSKIFVNKKVTFKKKKYSYEDSHHTKLNWKVSYNNKTNKYYVTRRCRS